MYPAGELKLLAARKDLLRRHIALRRVVTILAAQRALRPVRVADRLWMQWRQLSPLVKLAIGPLAALFGRGLQRKHGLVGRLIRWGPALAGLWRGFTRTRRDHVHSPTAL
jgi:hypothetical protein